MNTNFNITTSAQSGLIVIKSADEKSLAPAVPLYSIATPSVVLGEVA